MVSGASGAEMRSFLYFIGKVQRVADILMKGLLKCLSIV